MFQTTINIWCTSTSIIIINNRLPTTRSFMMTSWIMQLASCLDDPTVFFSRANSFTSFFFRFIARILRFHLLRILFAIVWIGKTANELKWPLVLLLLHRYHTHIHMQSPNLLISWLLDRIIIIILDNWLESHLQGGKLDTFYCIQ